jgi:deoxyribonucleoside regulator
MDLVKREMAIRASILYYEFDKNQNEIARELGISRSYVSQLLQYAKQSGVVEIHVRVDEFNLRMIKMEVELQRRYPDARQFFIMRSNSPQCTEEQIGKFAAPYILDLIRKANVIGIGVGTSIARVISGIEQESFSGTKKKILVQMLGGLTSDVTVSAHPNEIVQKMRSKLNCDSYSVNCPAVIENVRLRKALLEEPSIRRSTAFWNDIDLAIMGLGPANRRGTLFTMFSERMISEIESRKACGELNINFFDKNGGYIPLLEKNRVSIPYDIMAGIETKVVIGYGAHKVLPIIGALRGGLIDILFTDSLTAESIGEHVRAENPSA